MFVEIMAGYTTTTSLLEGQKVTISDDVFYQDSAKAIFGTKLIINYGVRMWRLYYCISNMFVAYFKNTESFFD